MSHASILFHNNNTKFHSNSLLFGLKLALIMTHTEQEVAFSSLFIPAEVCK